MIIKFLKKPSTLFIGMFLGIITGLFSNPIIVYYISIFSGLYTSLLQMCVIPLVACIITVSTGEVLKKGARAILGKWILYTFIAFLLCAVLGVSLGVMSRNALEPDEATKVKISQLDNEDGKQSISETFNVVEFYGENTDQDDNNFSISEFLANLIPDNIFSALANGDSFKIVVFFCILGAMIAITENKGSQNIIYALDALSKALFKFINTVLIFLPIGVFCIMAEQFSKDSVVSVMKSSYKLIIVIFISLIILMIMSFFIIQINVKCTCKQHLSAIKQTFFVSVATMNSLAVIPIAIEDCEKKLKLEKSAVNSFLPIGSTIFKPGIIVSSSIVAIFATTIYNVSINFNTVSIIFITAIMYSISIVGTPGIVAASMLTIILDPLGIPADVISLVFISLTSVCDSLCTFVNVYCSIAITAMLSDKKNKKEADFTKCVEKPLPEGMRI